MFRKFQVSAIRNKLDLLKNKLKLQFSSQPTVNSKSEVPLPATESYSGAMQVMHWGMGISILVSLGFVQAAQWEKPGKKKGELMFYHKSFGLLASGFLLPRIALRLTSKIPAHLPGQLWETIAASLTHAGLYAFMIFMPISGIVMGAYSGFGLPFFTFTIPSIATDKETAGFAYKYHKLIGHYAQYLIPIHIGAFGFHFVIKGNNILPRILSIGSKAAK